MKEKKIKFKNDKERIAFLKDYRNTDNGWYIWKHDDDLQRTWWRYDLDGCSFVVEKALMTFTYPKKRREWRTKNWYVIKDWNGVFGDIFGSRTIALAELKEAEKRWKEK